MTRGLASLVVFAMLALILPGQAFAVSSPRDNDAALRAMMDDRPHAPAAAQEPQDTSEPQQGEAPSGGDAEGQSTSSGEAQSQEPQTEQATDNGAEPVEEASGEHDTPKDAAAHDGETAQEGAAPKTEAKAEESGGWMSYIPFFGGSSKKSEAATQGDAPAGEHAAEEAKPADGHSEAGADHNGAAGDGAEAPQGEVVENGEHAAAPGETPHEGEAAQEGHGGEAKPADAHGDAPKDDAAHDAKPDEAKAESGGGWMSYIPFFGGSSNKDEPKAEASAHGTEAAKDEHAAEGGEPAAAPDGEKAHSSETPADGHGGDAQTGDAHGEKPKDDKAHEAKAESGGGWMSYIPFLGGGSSGAKPEKAAKDAHDKSKDGHGDAKEGQGEATADGHGGEAAGGEHGGEAAADHGDGPPPPPPMWPDEPAVEEAKQPYVRVRQLRKLQDQVARGSIAAYDQQKTLMRELAEEMRALPPEVWDDTRNVRAAVYFVFTGGDPRVLMSMLERETPIYVPRRLIRAALAYGEGRTVDAKQSLEKIEPDDLAPELQGLVALIKGTLYSKSEPQRALGYLDKARLFAPGSLVEESSLRQQILLVAAQGDMKRFDFLASAYARRFPRSLFSRNFRRQLFAGVAKQVFKGEDEWISRTETEMLRLTPGERAGLYLSIAEEATKGGHIKIALYAAGKATKLYPEGSRELDRARLYEGAVLVATPDRDRGIELLNKVRPMILKPADRELYDAAQFVALNGRPRTAEPRVSSDEKPPPSVAKAEELLKSTEALLTEETQ